MSQFSRQCVCGGRTSHEGNMRSHIHESSKKHQAYLKKITSVLPNGANCRTGRDDEVGDNEDAGTSVVSDAPRPQLAADDEADDDRPSREEQVS